VTVLSKTLNNPKKNCSHFL